MPAKKTDPKTLRTFERALRNALNTPSIPHEPLRKKKTRRKAKKKTAKKAKRKKSAR